LAGVPLPDEKKTTKFVDMLVDHGASFGLVVDESKIGRLTRLRNDLVHKNQHASEGQAYEAAWFTLDFVRRNVGPNLRAFPTTARARAGQGG
jgi:hypothetical protein